MLRNTVKGVRCHCQWWSLRWRHCAASHTNLPKSYSIKADIQQSCPRKAHFLWLHGLLIILICCTAALLQPKQQLTQRSEPKAKTLLLQIRRISDSWTLHSFIAQNINVDLFKQNKLEQQLSYYVHYWLPSHMNVKNDRDNYRKLNTPGTCFNASQVAELAPLSLTADKT